VQRIQAKFRDYLRSVLGEALSGTPPSAYDTVLKTLKQSQGHERTIETKRPVAADGSPLPWYTYPAIEYCNQLDASALKIFEYGSGNSSLYWANKGAKVWCVEHDPAWWEEMRRRSAQLCGLSLREDATTYAAAIVDPGETFDIVIIDGVWRNESAALAVRHVRKDGVIILDNSDWYRDVAGYLRANDYFQVDFNGFGPVNTYSWTTSFFLPFRSSLIERWGHPRPVGGIEAFKHELW